MSVNLPQSPRQSARKRSIVAFILSLLGFVLPLVIQFAATKNYNATAGIGNVAAWGPEVFITMVLAVGFIGWPLGVAALITGIVSLTTKAEHKGLAITGIIIAGIDLLALPLLALIVSGIVGQPHS
jgi:hypothetical protein